MEYFTSTVDKVDENFDLNKIARYNRSIQLSLDGFSYMITDPNQGRHLALREYNFGTEISLQKLTDILTEVFQSEDILKHNTAKTVVSFITRPWAMIPGMLFIKDKTETLININFKKEDFSEINHYTIPGTQIVFAASMPSVLHKVCNGFLNNPVFMPHQVPFIYNAFESVKKMPSTNEAFFMGLNHSFADTLFIKNMEIVFYNNFPFKQYPDLLYFTLATFEKLNLKPGTTPVFLQGKNPLIKTVPGMLNKYFGNIKIDNQLPEQNYTYKFDELELHKYKLLSGMEICG